MKHISPTFMNTIPLYLRLTTFTKTLPHISFHLHFLLFLFCSGAPPMTLLTARALTDPRLPATDSNVLMTTDARLDGVGRVPPPQQKSWLRRWLKHRLCLQLWINYCTLWLSSQMMNGNNSHSQCGCQQRFVDTLFIIAINFAGFC